MDKKRVLAIISVLIVITIYRLIGIENIPFGVTVSILIFGLILTIFSVIKFKGTKKENNYLKVMTALLVAFVGILITGVILQNYYPNSSEKYKPIIVVLVVILFISVVVVASINAIAKFKNSRYK